MQSPLKRLRVQHEMSIQKLQQVTKMSFSTIAAIEHGYNSTIRQPVLTKIAKLFKVDPMDFYDEYLVFYKTQQETE